jgi:hypothetical protein
LDIRRFGQGYVSNGAQVMDTGMIFLISFWMVGLPLTWLSIGMADGKVGDFTWPYCRGVFLAGAIFVLAPLLTLPFI